MRAGARIFIAVASLAGASAVVRAQEPSGPPPPSGRVESAGTPEHELLPDIGRIGAQVGALAALSFNPYEVGKGFEVAGFVDLPLLRAPGGKLSYEIFLALSLATSDPFETQSGPVATRLRLLQASPFGLRYTITRFDPHRVRLFLVAGIDAMVPSVSDEPAPPQDPARAARGLPQAETSIALGGHAGGGLEYRLSGGFSLAFEYRFAAFEGEKSHVQTLGSAFVIHF
jgi:hypothetical protein